MDKKLKKLKYLIKDLDKYDYIVTVRYIIYLVAKLLFGFKLYGSEILKLDFKTYKASYTFKHSIFEKYEFLDLNLPGFEESLYNIFIHSSNSLDSFCLGKLYEELLTQKEKKKLGQVYTPDAIIDRMIKQIDFNKINKNTKILDPSCGAGYFLIKLFIAIKANLNIDDKYIVENMLYGIDIDEFSIFMTKMGIFLASDLRNEDINFNILNIDFLTASFELGSFDIIIGNPPYLGHKNTSLEYKKILYNKYPEVYYDKADISYCFFKKSKDILKENGMLCFITSRYFMEALYADKIRAYIKANFNIVSLVDFSGNNIFKDTMVSPAILTLVNKSRNKNSFSYVKYNENLEIKFNYDEDKLLDTGWIILEDKVEKLFNKINEISNSYIEDVCHIKQGIITGCDKAFIVDENIIEKHNIERNLLKRWLKNSNISKNSLKYNNLYLIYSNIIDCEQNFPNAINYLTSYKDKLLKRRECINGYRKWYELQWGRNLIDFEKPKIIFPYKAKQNNFYYDENEFFCSADVYIMNNITIPVDYLVSYLNSSVFEFYFKCQAKKVGSDIYEYYPNKLNKSKIFLPQENSLQIISDLGKISIELFLKKVFNISEEEVNIINNYVKG